MFFKLAKLFIGFLLLVVIQYISHQFLVHMKINFPAPLLGMIVLSFLLYFKIISDSFIEDISDILLKNMSLFFVPLFVGIISFYHLIHKSLVPILVVVILATFITMILTALFVDIIIEKTSKRKIND